MDTFYDTITRWQPFFSIVAGIAATLTGLLFVSLSLNRERLAAPENVALRRLARRSFGDFLFALFISLMFVMPSHQPGPLTTILISFSIWRLAKLIQWQFQSRRFQFSKSEKWLLLRNFIFQSTTAIGLIVVAVYMRYGDMAVIYGTVPIVSLLVFNGTVNSWDLLLLENNIVPKPDEES